MDSTERRMCCKSMKVFRRNLLYYAGYLVAVIIVSLPTIFYVLQPDHPPHTDFNETSSAKTNLTSNSKGVLVCNSPLVPDNETGQCLPPCSWTTQSASTQKIYYGIVAVGLWLALIATVITFITWANIKKLRKFPHVLRFHIMVCCILLACCKMIPVRIGLDKVFCRKHLFWQPTGHSSFAALLQGATSHYFDLANSFWVMCFIANTYAVIIHNNRAVFKHPIKFHLIQSVLCWLAPAVIVAGCRFIAPPGYMFLFVDHLSAGAVSIRMAYFAVTLPMQVTLLVSLCLLWSIVWHIRKARLDSTKRVIRAREERVSLKRIERQFLSMAVVMLMLVGVVMAINTMIIYRVREFVHEAEVYFYCLKTSTNCEPPRYNTVLPLINIVAPGFLCLVFFFLLLMNKDCRQIWTGCFAKCKKFLRLCKPHPRTLRAQTELEGRDSRCSSTLTVLCDRRESELCADHKVELSTVQMKQPYPVHSSVARLKGEKPRASTLSWPATMNQRMAVSNSDIQIRLPGHAPPNQLDLRSRCNSVPMFLRKELETQVAIEQDKATTSSPSPLARELSDMKSTNSEDSDANSETDNFIRESKETDSHL
ncbi:hypothetical protein ACROYT_G026738 [Oculina patagonica]